MKMTLIRHNNNGDRMNIDIREYIINNFKEDNKEDIKKAIETSIASREEDPLLGMGVLFELAWNNSEDEIKNIIVSNIYKGINEKNDI